MKIYCVLVLKFRKIFLALAVLMLFGQFSISNAYAYLDPASLGFVMQAMIGVLIGVGVGVKLFWEKIKLKFTNRKLD
jgi:NhaP-type Na+/H+ or K+/H+ antiporter